MSDRSDLDKRERSPSGPGRAAGDDASGLRVLHIAESARGGVGTYLNQLLPEFGGSDAAAVASRVVMPAEHRFMLTRVDDGAIVTYRRGDRGPAALLRLAACSWREIRRFRPDIVHLHSSFAGIVLRPMLALGSMLARRRPAVIYSPHGWAFQITGSKRRQDAIVAVERLLALMSDRIVVLSDAERRECIAHGFPAAKLVRIYNGIDREPVEAAAADWRDDRLRVLFVGRFDRQKGLDTLMDAARRAPDRISVRCAGASVVGDEAGPAPPDNVEMLGWLDEAQLEAQYLAADIVAVPSRWEGFGLVAIEAMRARLPVVASRIGGLPEVVEEGRTGHLVPPDDPDALLAALLADDGESRRRLAEAGHSRFLANFTARRTADAIRVVYDMVAHGRGHGRG